MFTTSLSADVIAAETRSVLSVYRRQPVVFEHGRGCRLFTPEGRGYLDFISGVGVAVLGHGHPRLAETIAEQARTLLHTSNLFFHPLQAEVASRLTELARLDRAFLCNSGTEAVEACLKFARRFWHSQGQHRHRIVALEHAFHGRTMGALSVTWDAHYRAPFEPLLAGVVFVPADDPAALRAALTAETAAVILEPIQGEGGVRPLSMEMAGAVREGCRTTGALLIADEVQCGLGRTGQPFHSQTLGLQPDLIAVGKALGAGVPIAAALLSQRIADSIAFGDHGSTYGGNPLACRAALTFLDELTGRGLLEHVGRVGLHVADAVAGLASRLPAVRSVRGAGLMWGIELDRPAAATVEAALESGLLVNRTAETVIRLLPPYVITTGELDEGLGLLERAIRSTTEGAHA